MKWLEGGEDLKAGICRKLELAREMLGETGVCESWAKRIMGPHKMLSLKDKKHGHHTSACWATANLIK